MFYYEQRTMNGSWSPATSSTKPATSGDRLKFAEGLGPKIRALTEVNPGHYRLNLDQLREVYSPDGKFRFTGPRRRKDAKPPTIDTPPWEKEKNDG